MRALFCALSAACLLLCTSAAWVQDRPSKEDRLQKLIDVAIDGSPVVRPQAAERLTKMGGKARLAVLERLQTSLAGHAAETNMQGWFELGPDFLAMAARFTHTTPAQSQTSLEEGLRSTLWKAAQDRDFPWRAAVIQGLGEPAHEAEVERFRGFISDPLPGVRIASLGGLRQWEPKKRQPVLRKALQNETDDRVRRALAKFAFEAGDRAAAWYLFDDLHGVEAFFDQPIGKVGRIEAVQALRTLMPDSPVVDPALDPSGEEATAQRSALEKHLTEQIGPREADPMVAGRRLESPERKGKPVLGMELRSCRTGEHFLRWTDADQLWVGRTEPAVFDLPKGTVQRLLVVARGTSEQMGKQYLTGAVGCDLETHYLPVEGKAKPRRFLVTKGPAPILELRPKPLNTWAKACLETLPIARSSTTQPLPLDTRRHAVRSRVDSSLFSVGGDYSPE